MVSQREGEEEVAVTLSLAITHAPFEARRVEMVHRLLRSLGPTRTEVESQLTNLTVVTDQKRAGVWPTTKVAWVIGQRFGATHHLILPDDSVVCRDFIAGVKVALALVSTRPVVFYTGGPETKEAIKRGLSWTVLQRTEIGCLGIAMPVALIGDFLRWEKQHFDPKYKHSDVRLECWAYLTENWIWATSPSLAEHTGENQSLLGHDGMDRHRARWFIGEDKSALDIDWTLGLDAPPVSAAALPAFHRKVIR